MLEILAPHFAKAFLTRYDNSRSVAALQLATLLGKISALPYETFDQSALAWQAVQAAAQPDDLICITGSIFLAGELRPLLDGQSR